MNYVVIVVIAVMIFRYVNIVLIVKQWYHHTIRLLSEADSTNEFVTSRCVFVEDITTNISNGMLSPAKDN
jgi:cytosine/uracil/thiamine/allantoin permease